MFLNAACEDSPRYLSFLARNNFAESAILITACPCRQSETLPHPLDGVAGFSLTSAAMKWQVIRIDIPDMMDLETAKRRYDRPGRFERAPHRS
jgi:hypothetical protein